MDAPTVFLSYSWDSDAHRAWVAELAARLRADGVHTILDQWHAVPGDDLPAFMESAIRDNDFVLIVCTPKYRARADGRQGGVGYEGDIIAGELLIKRNHRKFVPILRAGAWAEAAPSNLLGRYYLDFRGDPWPPASYDRLLRTIHGELPAVPPVGPRPVFGAPAAAGAVRWPARVRLRADPRVVSISEVRNFVEDRHLFHDVINPGGVGIDHDYELIEDGLIVFDHGTGLQWKRGASRRLPFREAVEYVEDLNARRFAGHADWRLPTVEEALCLMQRESVDGYHLDPIFHRPPWIWTADTEGEAQWCVFFNNGNCMPIHRGSEYHVLPVRSGADDGQ